jgi:O-antigen/teichoic acid export membrane protein
MADAPHMRLGSRALANLTRGLGGSLPLALLAPLLAHRLGKDDFAVWVLVVQIASYVTYLEFGVQTAVSRMVGFRSAERGKESVGGPIAAGIRLLAITGSGGFVLVGVLTVLLPRIVSIPPGLAGTARLALVLLGGSASLALPGSAMHGALLGAGRNWLSAMAIVFCRFSSVGLTVFGAYRHWSVATLAGCLAVGSLLNATSPFLAARIAGLPSPWHRPSQQDMRELFGLTLTVGTWTVAVLLISGVDVLVVGVVEFSKVSAYGLAAGLVMAASAAYSILFSVLLPAFADFAARRDPTGAALLLSRSTSLSCASLTSGLMAALAIRGWLIDRWAGLYAGDARPIFVILMLTTVVRLSLAPLATYVMGSDHHRLVRRPAIAESICNLVLSVSLGMSIGATGVAIGSLIASAVPLLLYVAMIGPRTVDSPHYWMVMSRSYFIPLALCAPFIAAILLSEGFAYRLAIAVIGVLTQLALLRGNVVTRRAFAGPDHVDGGPAAV